MRWSLTLLTIATLLVLCTISASAINNNAGFGYPAYGSSYGQGYGYPANSPGYSYPSNGAIYGSYSQPTQQYSASDPAQRGIEAVKIAALKQYPSSNIWGYEYPYSMSYRSGTPMYVGHNYGMPSGAIYEYPAIMPNGIAEPTTFYGSPEYSMFMNYGLSFPFHGPVYAI